MYLSVTTHIPLQRAKRVNFYNKCRAKRVKLYPNSPPFQAASPSGSKTIAKRSELDKKLSEVRLVHIIIGVLRGENYIYYEVRHRPNVELGRRIPDSIFFSLESYSACPINTSSGLRQ